MLNRSSTVNGVAGFGSSSLRLWETLTAGQVMVDMGDNSLSAVRSTWIAASRVSESAMSNTSPRIFETRSEWDRSCIWDEKLHHGRDLPSPRPVNCPRMHKASRTSFQNVFSPRDEELASPFAELRLSSKASWRGHTPRASSRSEHDRIVAPPDRQTPFPSGE